MSDVSLRAKFAGKSDRDQALIASSFAIFLWGVTPLFIKALTERIDVPTLVVYRNLVTVPILWIVARASAKRWEFSLILKCLLPGALMAITMIFSFMAFDQTSIANATLIGAVQPALVMLVAPKLFGEKVTVLGLILAICAFGGVSMVILAAADTSGATMRGNIYAVTNVVAWTVYYLISKRRRDAGVDASSYIAAIMTVATIIAVPWGLTQAEDLGRMESKTWLLIFIVVLLPTAIGHNVITWAQKHLDVTLSSLMLLANPCISTVAAWIVRGDSLEPIQILGAGLVIGSLAGLVLTNRKLADVPFADPTGEPLA